MKWKKLAAWGAALLWIAGMAPVCAVPIGAAPSAPSVSAEAAVLMEAESGRLLWEKQPDRRLSMASTTKIMTALLALESERLEEPVTVTAEMLRTEGSSIYLKAGDCLTLRSLVAGLMLESGNDAALAIAITLDGSEAAFARRMNRRAAQLGMTNTHFVTASGLDDDAHYTTARDLAVLGCAAMHNPDFVQIVSKQSITVDFVDHSARRTFYNHNRLLREMSGCIGIKTGFTKKSGRCLVSCCERDGIRLVAVTLRAPDDWNDHKQLMNWGFAQVERVVLNNGPLNVTVPVVGAGEIASAALAEPDAAQAVIPVGRAGDIRMKLELEPFLYAPVAPDRVVGKITYWLDGEQIAERPLHAQTSIPAQPLRPTVWQKIGDFFARLFGRRT